MRWDVKEWPLPPKWPWCERMTLPSVCRLVLWTNCPGPGQPCSFFYCIIDLHKHAMIPCYSDPIGWHGYPMTLGDLDLARVMEIASCDNVKYVPAEWPWHCSRMLICLVHMWPWPCTRHQQYGCSVSGWSFYLKLMFYLGEIVHAAG